MVKIYDIKGNPVKELELPACFQTEFRPDLITKAFNIIRANRRQPYGSYKRAGHYVAESFGPGRGTSRVPRLSSGRAAFMPGTVKGRRAHPPKAEKNWHQKLNKKEGRLAKLSAIASTSNPELVKQRGHRFSGEVPIIVEEEFESINKTKDVLILFSKIGISKDIIRAKKGKHIRAGRGKSRGRKYKTPKSVLIVANNPNNLKMAASNLPGVDVVQTTELNTEHLAPGGHPGRITVFTSASIEKIGDLNGPI